MLRLAWRFAGAKPPYAYAIISVDFFDTEAFYAKLPT
jgi:hypothetical protein